MKTYYTYGTPYNSNAFELVGINVDSGSVAVQVTLQNIIHIIIIITILLSYYYYIFDDLKQLADPLCHSWPITMPLESCMQ